MPFYGVNYNTVRICSNGWLSFTSASTAFFNTALPNTALPNATIAPLWDDYDMRNNVGICLYRSDPALGRFIVEWKKVTRFNSPADTLTFQAILGSDGSITYNYLSVKGVLNSNTIGIENASGTTGLQVVFNQNYVQSGLSVLIQADQPWLSVTPRSGTVNPGAEQLVSVIMNPAGLSYGLHTGWVRINTNDPLLPVKSARICFTVEDVTPVRLTNLQAVSQEDGVSVSWETADDSNLLHCDILRSSAAGGDYVRLNPAPIEGEGAFEYRDMGVVDGTSYWYRVEAVDRDGTRQTFGPVSATFRARPSVLALTQNQPNPFRDRTTFRLEMPEAAPVNLRVHDLTGRLVRTVVRGTLLPAGSHEFQWDGLDDKGIRSGAGVYFLKAETPGGSRTVRMLLLR
jgi:hypothetical protein